MFKLRELLGKNWRISQKNCGENGKHNQLRPTQDHSAESLCSLISTMFQNWKITGKVTGIKFLVVLRTNNAQNIVNAIGLLWMDHFHCIAHALDVERFTKP